MSGTRQRYARVESEDRPTEDKRPDARSDSPSVPFQAICLAIGLLLAGVILLTLGALHLTEHVVGKDGAGWGLVTLGALTFIPGFHQSRIAYYAWRGRRGYSFDDIPRMQ
mmetsp:Transcript_16028/g.40966  ORF Transcript_16028/g.40966 Transcript_16028/m.40966 type:complete len:110 (+) Transcript_16028:292-621(+)|eukprot:jgi/Tetstr1/426376/TSEL_016688.t1